MRIKHAGRTWDVYLEDDGTLDTVISVDGHEVRYDSEGVERDPDTGDLLRGELRRLAIEAIDDGLIDEEGEE